jgi:hypothetical protein
VPAATVRSEGGLDEKMPVTVLVTRTRIAYNFTITTYSSACAFVAGLPGATASGCRGLYKPMTRITALA